MVSVEVLSDAAVSPDPRDDRGVSVYPVPCVLDDGSVICAYRQGSTKHSRDASLLCCRSTDRGLTWQHPVDVFDRRSAAAALSVHAGAVAQAGDGSIVAVLTAVTMADEPDSYIFSAQGRTLKQQLYGVRSLDGGVTWGDPQPISLGGAAGNFYVGTRPHPLVTGELLLVLETTEEDGRETVVATALNPHDLTCSVPVPCVDDPTAQVSYGDGRCTQLDDGRILLLTWAFATGGERSFPPHRSTSSDGGRTWTAPSDTRTSGQVISPLSLGEGRVIAATNLRAVRPGIRLRFSDDEGQTFRASPSVLLWEAREERIVAEPLEEPEEGAVDESGIWDELPDYSFGYPDLVRLDDGSVLLTYYAVIGGATVVRACSFRVDWG